MLQKLRFFFRDDLWNFPLAEEKGWRYLFFKWLRIADLSIWGFLKDHASLYASALTFYTLMSLVPILAVALAVARGFGLHEDFQHELLTQFQEHKVLLTEIIKFAQKTLEQVKGGVVAGYGFVILFWSVSQLFRNMEGAFNHIWKVKKFRNWKRVITDYFALMLLGPIFYLIASSLTVFITTQLEQFLEALLANSSLLSLVLFFVKVIPYCLFWAFFTFIYLFMPNAKVNFSAAAIGGIVSGVLYVLLQKGYIYFQVGVSRYGAIYGSFAALPLFLIWIQLSWSLLLFGGSVSYSLQSLDSHEFEEASESASIGFKRLLSLWIVHIIVSRVLKERSPLQKELLLNRYRIPPALVESILAKLLACRLIIQTEDGGFVPGRAIEELKISDVIEAFDGDGNSEFPYIDSKGSLPFVEVLEHFKKEIQKSKENKLLKDVSISF